MLTYWFTDLSNWISPVYLESLLPLHSQGFGTSMKVGVSSSGQETILRLWWRCESFISTAYNLVDMSVSTGLLAHGWRICTIRNVKSPPRIAGVLLYCSMQYSHQFKPQRDGGCTWLITPLPPNISAMRCSCEGVQCTPSAHSYPLRQVHLRLWGSEWDLFINYGIKTH